MGTAELIIFAIQAAIRLAEAARRALVDSTRRQALTLPLPDFPAVIDANSAADFYKSDGSTFNVAGSDIQKWTDLVFSGQSLPEAAERDFVARYLNDRALLIFRKGSTTAFRSAEDLGGIAATQWTALLEVRQWRKGGDPNPSTLQRLAGTLIEVGVDYFQSDPSLLRTERPTGKAIQSFLSAIGDVSFSTEKPPRLAVSLFGALAESVQANPELFGADDASRLLVDNVTRAVAKDAQERIAAAGDTNTEEGIEAWATLLFRSMLRSAGDTVLSAPGLYLGVEGGRPTLVETVGRALLGAVIQEDAVHLGTLFTQSAMDGVVQAALRAVAASPDLLGIDHSAVSALVRAVAGELAESSQQVGPDLLPDAIRLVLDKTAEHVDLLLPQIGAPPRPLLVTASRVVLERLAKPDPAEHWRPRFAKADALAVLGEVLDQVTQNPGWMTQPAGTASSPLAALLDASLKGLAAMPVPRLRPASALRVLRAAVAAGGRRLELLDVDPASGERLATQVLDAVFSTLRGGADARAAWTLARDEVVTAAAIEALERLADQGVTSERIKAVRGTLLAVRNDVGSGAPFDLEGLGERVSRAIAAA
jgi:hypothetical protein